MNIREAKLDDWDKLWLFVEPIIRAGETYPCDPEMSKEAARDYWFTDKVYMAELDGKAVGTYYMKANQQSLGSHVANAGYMVDPNYHGRGIGKALGGHSIDQAKKLGYSAMQFNLVVVSNEASIKLWQKFGFKIIGTVPQAFNHKKLGLIDAHIMHKLLD